MYGKLARITYTTKIKVNAITEYDNWETWYSAIDLEMPTNNKIQYQLNFFLQSIGAVVHCFILRISGIAAVG